MPGKSIVQTTVIYHSSWHTTEKPVAYYLKNSDLSEENENYKNDKLRIGQ